jgi:hypothetical protein
MAAKSSAALERHEPGLAVTGTHDYHSLLRGLLDRRLSPAEFQAAFVPLFKSDQSWRPTETYAALNDAFLAAEAYADDPDPDDAYAVDADELYRVAASAEARLAGGPGDGAPQACP